VCVGSVVGQQPCGSSFITTIVTADASTATQTLPCNVPNNLRLTQATFAWQWEKLRPNLSVERQLPLTMHTATQELTSSIYTLQSVDCKTTGIYEARYLETIFNIKSPRCFNLKSIGPVVLMLNGNSRICFVNKGYRYIFQKKQSDLVNQSAESNVSASGTSRSKLPSIQ